MESIKPAMKSLLKNQLRSAAKAENQPVESFVKGMLFGLRHARTLIQTRPADDAERVITFTIDTLVEPEIKPVFTERVQLKFDL